MPGKTGIEIVRVAEIPWEDRVNVDGWPSRGGMYYDDRDNQLCLRLIDYPRGSTEPRHVHAGTHATTVLKGRAIVDGLTLGPLDVIIGPGGEPHGPLQYPDGCKLLSAFQGSYFHSEVERLSSEKRYRLVQSAGIPWTANEGDGARTKTLVDHGCERLVEQVLRFSPGGRFAAHARPQARAMLVVEGGAEVEGETLGLWDFFRVPSGVECSGISFPSGAMLLAISLR